MADKNQDGKVTKDEVSETVWERISTADANKDGAITPAELDAHWLDRSGRPGRPDADKAAEKAEDKPTDNPAEKSDAKPEDKPAEKKADGPNA
jgi:hypothetical protein